MYLFMRKKICLVSSTIQPQTNSQIEIPKSSEIEMSEIKVFLRSTVISSNLLSLHYSYDYHYYMEEHHRGNYHWLRDQGFSKGRIFEPDCAALLPDLSKAMAVFDHRIRVIDLNTFEGKFNGLRVGIRKSPSIIFAGQKHIGLSASRDVLHSILENHFRLFDNLAP